jgi:hypothetical protein
VRNVAASVASVLAGILGFAIGAAIVVAMVVGGTFYRSECPSKTSWQFNPIPFISTIEVDSTACRTETATSYYAGKIPVIGGVLRGFVRSVQDSGPYGQ